MVVITLNFVFLPLTVLRLARINVKKRNLMVSGWASSHSHTPRRSHDQNAVPMDKKHSRSSSPDNSTEPPRRSSSDATPRQTPATTRFLSPTPNDQDTSRSVLTSAQDVFSSSKRLGFFADKLTSSISGATHSNPKSSLHPSQLLHPHSHSRSDSSQPPTSSTPTSTMATSSSMTNVTKSHTSPSKVQWSLA